MKDIPLHQLKDRATSGMELFHFVPGDSHYKSETLGAHRDDHYIFFLVESGDASLMIDFHEIRFSPPCLYYVLPGQVHHRINNVVAGGWFMAIDTLLIPPDYRKIFENQLFLQQPYALNDTQLRQCREVLGLLFEKYAEDEKQPFCLPVMHSLLQSFLGMAAGCFSCSSNQGITISRPVELAQQFKLLLVENLRTLKSPSAYAEKLNVSESYLNESLKKVTGLSVSYWIQHEVMLEAKRLLYYSEMNVKEIAHALGYTDHAYFSRIFKKAEGSTPLAFRTHYRK
ncbi:helix-turn-helix transcriptional regulator [Mucilaginibacter gynuensis]